MGRTEHEGGDEEGSAGQTDNHNRASRESARERVRFHPIVREARETYRSLKPDPDGFYVPRRVRGLKLRIGKGSLDRALRILDQVIKAAEAKGYKAALSAGTDGVAQVTVGEERVEIGMREESLRIPHVATKHELEEAKKWSWRKVPEYDRRPSGNLTVVVGNYLSSPNSTCTEGKRWKLEDRIDHIVDAIERVAQKLRDERIERERRHREWEEQSRRRAEEAERRRAEEKRVEQLLGHLEAWRRSKEIRAFLAEIRQLKADAGKEIDPEGELGRWLTWVESYAEQSDSLRELRREAANSRQNGQTQSATAEASAP